VVAEGGLAGEAGGEEVEEGVADVDHLDAVESLVVDEEGVDLLRQVVRQVCPLPQKHQPTH
jgi:hypothetical protein